MSEDSIIKCALRMRSNDERAAFLDKTCGRDAALRQRVEARLQAQAAGSGFGHPTEVEQPAAPLSGRENTEAVPTALPAAEEGVLLSLPTTARETQEEQAGNNDQALDFLEPSTKPGVLGRLGHYEVTGLVGRGGMGVVLRAFDEKLLRVVAIKTMALELAATATARKRFIREAQAAAAVCHEHVVTIHAVEEDHRPPYLVMQYVEGCSLQDKLRRAGPLSLREILRIGMQTAAGLAAAHKQGLVHRDIKPANILLEDNVERVKITDFGLARASDDASLTQSGIIAGTPQYMSPEQAEAKPIDHRSDLFSLGSVLYALCTGRAPFRANSTMAVLRRVCDDQPRPIREVNPDIPEWLCDIINKLHAKEPAARFQSAAEVAELLGSCLARLQQGAPIETTPAHPEQPSTAPPPTLEAAPARTRRLSRMSRLAVVGVIFLCVWSCIGSGFWLLVSYDHHRRWPWEKEPSSPVHLSQDAKGDTPRAQDGKSDLLKDALLVMDFEKDSFYEKDGKTYVRDRSGHGNDGLCENVAFTPEGKAGGGLACNGGYLRLDRSLINRLPEYTITAWVLIADPSNKDCWLYARAFDRLASPNYHLYLHEGMIGVTAWNRDYQPDLWLNTWRNGPKIPKERWVFIAAVLRNGDVGKGDLRLSVDDRVRNLKSQMVDGSDDEVFDYLGANGKITLDEVAVFPRALSDQDIQSIRRAGIDGKPLSLAKLKASSHPLSRSDLLKDALLVMDFEKDSFYKKDGKTYVRDRSGHGNDGLCENVAFTPEGKAGGGLACNGGYLRLNQSFINRLPNYTIAAWLHVTKVVDGEDWSFYLLANQRDLRAPAYHFSYGGGGDVVVDAWNRDRQPEPWLNTCTHKPVFTIGKWVFVAAVLRDGAVNSGDLRLTVDHRVYPLRSQMTDNGDPNQEGVFDYLGKGMHAVIDEVIVLPHALSDVDVQAIRRRGIEGKPLHNK